MLTRPARSIALVAAFSLGLTACLSGFSEIRVVRPDAAAVDAARLDVASVVDAPSRPSDAPDASQTPDVLPTEMDASEVAVTGDVEPGVDAVDVFDAGVQLADVVDVAREDHVDAGAPSDGADVFDVQCPTLLCNGVCVDTSSDRMNCGRCGVVCPGRCLAGSCVRFAGVVPVVPRDRYLSTPDPRAEWETLCRGLFPGSRVCRAVDVQDTPLHAEICAVVWPMRPKQSPSRAVAAVAETPRPMATVQGSTSYVCAECDYRGPLNGWVGGCFAPHAIACCSP